MAQKPTVSDERLALHLRTEKCVRDWIEAVLRIKLGEDLQKALETGVILCYLMLEIEERSIPRIQEGTTSPWRLKENIHFFLLALQDYGIGRHRMFLLSDLMEGKNMVAVVECLAELARVANSRGFTVVMKNPEQDTSALPNLPAEVKRVKKEQIARLKDKTNERTRVKVSAEIVRRKLQVLAGQGIDWPKFEHNLSKFQALVRGHRARKRFQSMVRDVAYRANVAKEILETEKTYVSSLSNCIKVFMSPLEEAAQKNSKSAPATKDDIRVIFSDIQVILNFHVTLLSDMEPRVKEWTARQCLGDIFLKIISFLKVYTNYLQNFNDSNTRLHSLMRNEKFNKFMEDCKQNVGSQRLDLPSYLIMPVQRIPRYNLLLKDLAKHTWPEHPDYEALNDAVTQVATIGTFLNSKKKEAENMSKLLEMTTRITKLPSNLVIPEPHRRLVQEFPVPEQKTVVYYFNDMILVARMGNLVSKKDVKYKDHFFMLSSVIKDAPDDKHAQNILIIERDGHHKPFKLVLPTPAAKAEILKEHAEQKKAAEALMLEKKKEMQEKERIQTGQTNEEILHNRKKKSNPGAGGRNSVANPSRSRAATTTAAMSNPGELAQLVKEKGLFEARLAELQEKKKKKSKKELELIEEQRRHLERDLALTKARIEELQASTASGEDGAPRQKGSTVAGKPSPASTPTASPAPSIRANPDPPPSSSTLGAPPSPNLSSKEEKKKKKGLMARLTGGSESKFIELKTQEAKPQSQESTPTSSPLPSPNPSTASAPASLAPPQSTAGSSTPPTNLAALRQDPRVSSGKRLGDDLPRGSGPSASPGPERRATVSRVESRLSTSSSLEPVPPQISQQESTPSAPIENLGPLSLEQIKQTRTTLDQTKLEAYLSEAEFVEVFKMSKEEFYKLPQWKRNQQKKAVSLL